MVVSVLVPEVIEQTVSLRFIERVGLRLHETRPAECRERIIADEVIGLARVAVERPERAVDDAPGSLHLEPLPTIRLGAGEERAEVFEPGRRHSAEQLVSESGQDVPTQLAAIGVRKRRPDHRRQFAHVNATRARPVISPPRDRCTSLNVVRQRRYGDGPVRPIHEAPTVAFEFVLVIESAICKTLLGRRVSYSCILLCELD